MQQRERERQAEGRGHNADSWQACHSGEEKKVRASRQDEKVQAITSKERGGNEWQQQLILCSGMQTHTEVQREKVKRGAHPL